MTIHLKFLKTGREIREAVSKRIDQLTARLEGRNRELDRLMRDKKRLRSYLVRSTQGLARGHGHETSQLYSKADISSEELEEIRQMCARIYEIEQEIYRLALIRTHLADDQEIELLFHDLIAYGFDSDLAIAD